MNEGKRHERLQTLYKKLKFERALMIFGGVLVAIGFIYAMIKNEPFAPVFLLSLNICLATCFSCHRVNSEIRLLETISALHEWFADAADL